MKKIILFAFLLTSLIAPLIYAEGAPDISVTLLNQDPDPAIQGDIIDVRFKIENVGQYTTNEVEVEILPEYPFTLYSGEAIRNLGKLRASQTGADAVIVNYKLKVDESAVEGENEIKLKVKMGGIEFSFPQDTFLIRIGEYYTPTIKAYIKETTIFQPNSRGTITLELANIDKSDIKFLQLTLLPSEDYKLLSSSNYLYLGDIDSDDTESEDFDIFVQDVKDGKVNVPILLQYKNSEDKEYKSQLEVSFNVYTPEELSKYNLQKKSYLPIIIIFLILIFLGYLYWRRRKKEE